MQTLQSLWKGEISARSFPLVRVSKAKCEAVVEEVAKLHGLRPSDVLSWSRQRHIVHARQEVMWRLREERWPNGDRKHSLPIIGLALGGMDHTTVLHGVKAHAARMREATRIAAE